MPADHPLGASVRAARRVAPGTAGVPPAPGVAWSVNAPSLNPSPASREREAPPPPPAENSPAGAGEGSSDASSSPIQAGRDAGGTAPSLDPPPAPREREDGPLAPPLLHGKGETPQPSKPSSRASVPAARCAVS